MLASNPVIFHYLIQNPRIEAGMTPLLLYEESLDHQFVEWTGTACYKRRNSQQTRGKTCLIENINGDKCVGAVFKIAPK